MTSAPTAEPKTVAPEHCAVAVVKAQRLLQLAAPGELDAAIHAALALIGSAWEADRAYVFVMRDMVFIDNTHEWCAADIDAAQDMLQEIPYSVGELFWASFRKKGAIYLQDINTIPKGSELHQALSAQQIRSLIAVPLFDGAEIRGFVGLDFCHRLHHLAPCDIPLLQSFATTLALSMAIETLQKADSARQTELQNAHDRIESLSQSLPELLIELDGNGHAAALHHNPQMTFALDPAEALGRQPEAFLTPHVARLCRKAMVQVDDHGWSAHYSYLLTIAGQEKRYMLYATGKGRHDRDRGYLLIIRDITDSYLPERQSHLFARIAGLSSNMIILTDALARISWINPACTERTGYALSEAKGGHPVDLLRLRDTDPAASAEMLERMCAAGSLDAELRAMTKADLPYWVKLILRPLQDPDGTLQGFMLIGNDLTTQKRAETRALRDRATAMDALPEAIALIERDGRCAYLNPALRNILNLPDDVPSTALLWHDISPEAFNRQLGDLMPRLYAKGTWRGEFNWSQDSGNTLYFDISISVQEDGGFLFIARDITARKQAEREEALLREQVQIAQSRQLVAQLASGLAHDVANVLAVIAHVTASIKQDAAQLPGQALERIDRATAQAQALVANLSHLGRRRPRDERLDLRPAILQAADLVRPSLGSAIRLNIILPPAPLHVMADVTSIMQVVLNLVLNARDALDAETGLAPSITLDAAPYSRTEPAGRLALGHLRADCDYAYIRVTDTGSGLTPETAAMMFDPYVSTKGADGIGLGLSIVADIIRRAQGAIHVQSRLGRGTAVTVYWPLAGAAKTQDTSSPAAALPLDGARILLVDDDDDVLRHFSLGLSAAGADVASCIDPMDALAVVTDAPDDWDLVITDHDMGTMTGVDLAEQLTKIRADLPIMLVTGGNLLQNASRSVHSAIRLTLQKPVSADVLVAVALDLLLRRSSHGPDEASTDAPSHRG